MGQDHERGHWGNMREPWPGLTRPAKSWPSGKNISTSFQALASNRAIQLSGVEAGSRQKSAASLPWAPLSARLLMSKRPRQTACVAKPTSSASSRTCLTCKPPGSCSHIAPRPGPSICSVLCPVLCLPRLRRRTTRPSGRRWPGCFKSRPPRPYLFPPGPWLSYQPDWAA